MQVPLGPAGLTYGASVPSSFSLYVFGSRSMTVVISTALSVCATRNVQPVWLSIALTKSGLAAADNFGPHSAKVQISIETVEIEAAGHAVRFGSPATA